MPKIHREPNRFKRWYSRQFFTIGIEGQEVQLPRFRWWPLIVWLGHNLLIFVWVLVSAIAGRSVSFDSSSWWYAPARFMLELLR